MEERLLTFIKLKPNDEVLINQVANWYYDEWGIAIETTKNNLHQICDSDTQAQVVLFAGGEPVATGGVYHHVGLLNHVPRLNIHKHWLALVYTLPQHRNKGHGVKLCRYLQHICHDKGIEKLYLFTHTAESMYQKLGWKLSEKLKLAERDISVMYIELH